MSPKAQLIERKDGRIITHTSVGGRSHLELNKAVTEAFARQSVALDTHHSHFAIVGANLMQNILLIERARKM